MKIQFIEEDQDWTTETTRYWFNVDGQKYCIADKNGDLTLYDCDDTQDLTQVMQKLSAYYEWEVQDEHFKIYNALIYKYFKL